MQAKLSKAKLMHKRNAEFRTIGVEALEKANAEKKSKIMKLRKMHFDSLKVFPLFEKLLSKKIPFHIYTPKGKHEYILLGTGLKGEANFRRTAIVIDDKGRMLFLGEKIFGNQKEWFPYRIVRKEKVGKKAYRYEYNELEQGANVKLWIDNSVSDEVKKHLKEIEFINADAIDVKRIKKYM